MYTSSELVRDHHRSKLEQTRQARYARTLAQLRKAKRVEQRAERDLLRAWHRSDELRASLETR
jgi:hypothetical protein